MKYSDAVRILKGVDSTVVAALDAVAGGLLLAVVPLVPALAGWLDAKSGFVRRTTWPAGAAGHAS